MPLNTPTELGRIIGGLVNTTNQIQSDHVETDINQSLVLTPIDRAKVETTVTIIRQNHDGHSLVLDHPVYGELDNSTLSLDGGYLVSETGAEFPLDFSNNSGLGFSFDEKSVSGSSLIGIYTG